ncbi:MAG: leucine-rich repeat protein, partial [Anaeroplasmataceae bacterium]|nr:leucine-rich repeat protein [Anaeroplasmataceae bacterium]
GQQAFSNCHFLESINLENILTVGARAFRSCQSLKYVNMPLVEVLPWAVFSSCGNLKMADLSGVIEIGQDVFNECYELEKVICPNLETLDAAFKETISLKSVDTKNVIKIIGNAFIYSKSIEELYFPNLETITSGGVFSCCPSLKKVVIGEKFENYVVDQTLDLASWTYYNVPIYGYSGSKAEEWALKCQDETKTKHWDFVAIDDIDNLAITKDLSNEVEVEYNSLLKISVEAEGIGLTYQWFRTNSDILSGTPIKDATDNQLEVDTSTSGSSKYFVQVSDWKGNVISSQICEVTIVQSDAKSIEVTLGEHISSSQSGNNQVSEGENFKVTFTVETGYHISSIVVDEVNLSEDELETAILDGYTFTNITENHTITINSAPNEDTEYKVYHYKESLVETEIEIDGKYYELETETLTGTTGTLTTAVENTYQGFTAEAFEQKIINGNGNTIVEILYNRNTYTVTLVDCEGVTVEGGGTYLYGETVVVTANVEDGYIWVGWESSNSEACPNKDTLEYIFTMPSEDITLTTKADEVQADSVYISVTIGEHISSSQSGNNQVSEGENFKVTFTFETGYHISSIVVDEVALTGEELSIVISNGYTFENVLEDHTIQIISSPNEDTEYKVYHYKESLAETEIEIDGKYYELETETLTGTTGTLTTAVENTYQGFTAEAFEQKIINGNGNTIVEILYNRNTYTVTLVDCEGVTVEGGGTYLYGQTVVVNANVDEGYVWVEWESSNPDVCSSNDSIEYTFPMPSQNIELIAIVNTLQPEKVNIRVSTKEHISSPQRGNNQVAMGETLKVTFTAEIGYHISSIVVDEVGLNEDELETAILDGYTFTNITENHTITINSAPNEDTEYKVYHYIQSLEKTEVEIDGKYYKLETETLTGTTGNHTPVVARKYEGFTAEAFEQKIINGNGTTIVEILYNRNTYTVTIVDCEGVTVEGGGTYLYGETVIVTASVDEGYVWVEWESSNTNVCPNKNTKEYTFCMPSQDFTLTAKVDEVPSELLHINVVIGQHMNSLQSGDNLVNIGDNFKVTLTIEIGYHIASIIVDKTVLSANEMNNFLKDGYTFKNITENHTITINSTPNEDTEYKVYHYIQSLVETPYKINGKYYTLEKEDLTGTTGTLTTIVARKYEGFTAASFQQKIISGNGNTIITLLYNRNTYIVTLVDCEGVTVEGGGTYLYGETVLVQANVDEGYKWIGWESSNTTACPNKDTKEYTFSMPSCSIELKAVATELDTPEQLVPSQPGSEQPNDTKEKGFNFVLWISIGVSLFILIVVMIILIILLVKKNNKKKNELNKNL